MYRYYLIVNTLLQVFLVRRMEEGNAEIHLLKDEDFFTVGKDRFKWKYMNQSQKGVCIISLIMSRTLHSSDILMKSCLFLN